MVLKIGLFLYVQELLEGTEALKGVLSAQLSALSFQLVADR
jgi:hypothetical protein